MASVLMELNHQRPHPQTIDSVHQDNPSENDHKNKAARITCNHFSIRGYVAEVRNKEPILCDPFSRLRADDGSDSMEYELPPMVVPKFRWWKCDGCVPDSSDTTPTPTPTETPKPPHNKPKQLTVTEPNSEGVGEHNADVPGTSYDSNPAPNCPLLPAHVADDPKGKEKGKGKARVEHQLMELPTGCKENGIMEPRQKNSALVGLQKGPSEGCMDAENGKAGSVSELPDLNEGDKDTILESVDVNVCEEEDDYLGVGRRKARKVRLLSELLGTEETQTDNAKLKKTRSVHSEASDPESEDDKSTEMMVSGDSVRKRGNKSTAGEKSLAEKRSNKKIKTSEQGDCNTTKITPKSAHSEASEHKSADDKSTETMMSEDLVKKRSNRSTTDEKSLLEKKKNKKMKTNDQGGCSSTKIPPPPKSSKENPSQEVHSDQVTDLLRKSDGSSELNEKRQGLAKRKGKMVQVAKEKACLKECSAFRKDDKEASTQKATKNVQNELSNGPIIIDYGAVRKQTVNSCIRDSSVGFTVATCQAEEGRSPLAQHNAMQVSGSITNQKEPSRRMQDIDINSIPIDDKGSEEAKGDDGHDIPMDIVELMAKNQYERNLGDHRGKRQCVVSVPENVRSDGSASTCGQQLPKLTKPHFLSWHSPFSKDSRSNLTNGYEAAINSPFSKFNQSHLSFTGHNISNAPVSDKPYYSAFNFSAKNWTGHKEAPQRCAPSFLSTTAPYRPHIEPHGWPSGVAKGQHLHQGSSVLNFSSVGRIEKQINFSSNTFAGASSQKRGAGSRDLYSNDAIPAMHLLSLMQNAGNSDQLKKPPIVPTVCSFASLPFQSDGRKPGFVTQIPLTSHGQRNIGSPHFASFRPQILPVSPSNIGRKRLLDSGSYKGQKGKFEMPNLPHSDIPLQGSRNNVGSYPQRFDKKTIRPIPQEGICVLNQNPSEFNDLKELRKYMIKPEDLRPRERRVQHGNAKRQETRMDKHVACGIRKLATQASPM